MPESTPPVAEASAPSPARPLVLLAVLLTAVVVIVFNNSMVAVLLPQIRQDFAASAASANWVVTGYSLTFAVGTPLYGRVSDVFGVRWVFCVGLAVFAGASVLAGLADQLSVLITARVLQGAGGSAVPALSAVAISRVLPAGRRGLAFGLVATGVGAGQALGPVLGGVGAQAAGWSAPFLGSAVLTLPVLLAAGRVLPGGDREARVGWRRLDLLGGMLLGSTAALALVGVTRVQQVGLDATTSWGSMALAAVGAVTFAIRIRTAVAPFAPPALFANTGFLTAIAVGFLTLFSYMGVLVLVPQLVSSVNGLAAGQIGLILLPGALVVVSSSAAVGRLSDRAGPRPLITGGSAVLVTTVLALSTVAGESVLVIGALMLGMGLGLSLIVSPTINAAATALPNEHSGVGLGMYQGAFFLGGGTGAAALGAILSARTSGAQAWNPLHDGPGSAFSDTLLVVSGVLLIALLLASRLPKPSRPVRHAGGG